MSNQSIRINLMFDANVASAKSNIQQLATLLQQIATPKNVVVNGGAIQQAAQAAQTLQMHLQNAMNVNTGKLDLTKLNFSLKQAGTSITDLSAKLVASGTQGQQAFTRLANAIAQAGAPAAQLNATVTQFMKTMGSAMMWSAAYGALNGITEAISGAVDYATDLNKALNDIAIVSDLSAESLDAFAIKAAKAAKDLNTTTTEYAKAALIFYQQGLSGKEVEERANVVTKLAQVTGESAQAVSDQLTAIWNNFDDGSKSLEYYADALTALGAATAASTDEITEGLEKFAAIADTVGLSYEYATAALATVVDKTRQSADVVGTAFKTLFARISDLELGKTLDDGVTLGKYSQALAAIGVNILDQNGGLKDMDNILDEIGSKWDSLTSAQQTALAQTVAGIRQYTQFIAIMDNYKDFQVNVDIASGSEGTLTDQWNTWAKSYDAAAKRVEQRKNELYESLLDDDFVIGLTDTFAGLIGSIGEVADAMGGLGPIILTIIGLFAAKLVPVISNAASHFIQNWRVMTGAAQQESLKTKEAVRAMTEEMIRTGTITGVQAEALELTNQLSLAKERLTKSSKFLTAAQQEEYNQRMNLYEAGTLQLQQLIELEAQSKREAATSKKSFMAFNSKKIKETNADFINNNQDKMQEVDRLKQKSEEAYASGNKGGWGKKYLNQAQQLESQMGISSEQFKRIQQSSKLSADQTIIGTSKFVGPETFDANDKAAQYSDEALKQFLQKDLGMAEVTGMDQPIQVDTSIQNLEKVITKIQEVKTTGSDIDQFAIELENSLNQVNPDNIENVQNSFKKLATQAGVSQKDLDKFNAIFDKLAKGEQLAEGESEELRSALEKMRQGTERTGLSLEELESEMLDTFAKSDMGDQQLQELAEKMHLSAEDTERLRQKLKALKEEGNNLNLDIQMTKGQAFGTLIGQAGQLAGSLSMLASAVQMLGTAFDSSAEPGQRFTSLLMGISMLLPAIITLTNAEQAAQVAASAATLFGAKVKAGATAVELGDAAAKSTNTVATWLLNLAQSALNGTALSSLVIFGLLLAALLVVVGVVALLVVGIKALVNWWNQDAIAAEKAAEKAKELAEAYQNTKQAYEDLKSSIADYEEAQNAIAKLKEGTEEWRDAIYESNQQIMDLIEKYPELIDYVENVNGVLKITDPDAVEKIYRDRTDAMYNASLDANLYKKQTENRANRTDFIRNEGDYYTAQDWMLSIGAGTLVGNVSGAAVGLANAIIENDKSADKMDDAITKLSEAFQKDSGIFANFDETLKNLQITDPALVEALKENKEAVLDLVRAEKETLAYEQLVKEQKVDNMLNSAGFHSDNYTEHVQDLVVQKYDEEVAAKRAGEYNSDDWRQRKWYTLGIAGGTDEGEKRAKEYAQLMGYEDFDVTNFKGDKIKFKYKDENGEVVKDEVTYEEMEKRLAENAVAQEDAIIKYATRISQTISSLNNSGSTLGQAMGSFLSEGDFSYAELTEDQIAQLKEGTLDAIFPPGTDLEQAAIDFGYGTVDAMTTAIQKAAEEYDPVAAAANIARRTAQEVQAIFDAGAQELGTSTDALELYAEHLINTNKGLEGNKKAAAQASVAHFKMAKGLNTLQKTFKENAEVLKKADKNSIDYYEALGKVNQAIEETFGVKVSADFLENEQNLEDLEKAANNDVEALKRLKKAINEDFILNLNINENAKNILNQKLMELSDQALNNPIGTSLTLNDDQAIAALNEALYTGEATIEQIESMFNNANLQMPEYKTQWVDGEVTQSHSETTVTGPLGIKYTTSSDTTTTAKKAIPYFGDTPPAKTSSGGMNYGGGSLNITTTGNAQSQASTLTYEGDEGGGGGGGGSSQEKKNIHEETERYHKIDKTLERLQKQYDKISKARDRAFGQKYLDYLDQEIAKTEELAEATRAKLEEAEANLALDREAMARYGMSTNEYGEITNYEEMIAAQVAQYNTNPEAYEDSYQEFMDNLARYEETLALVQDLGLELDDYNYQMQDLALERIQYEVDLQVRLADNELARLEWQIDRLGDSIEDAADKFALMSQQIEISVRKAEAARQGITNILDAHGLIMEQIEQAASDGTLNTLLADSNFTESEVAALEEYMNSLYEETANMEEYFDSFSEQMVATFEDMNEGLDKAIDKIDHMNSMMENFRSIIDLVGADTLGISNEMLEQLSETQYELARNNVSVARSQLEQNQAALAALEQEIAEAQARGDERSVEELQEAYDEIYATVQENEQALLEATAAALEARRKLFEDEMNNIMKVFEQAMSGQYGSFSAMEQAYEQQKELSNLFLQDYEKIYELSKLTREITNSIDETDNIRAKERLRDIQEEINALQESNTQMTQFEVDELRARYEMRLAEIALEEAQNAKSKVRMQRDVTGNWGYVYTADQEAIDSAMQAYEDKMYAYQNLLNGHIEEMQDRLISIPREYAEAVAAIYADQTLTDEERRLRIKETQDYYQAMYDYAVTEMGQTIDRSKTFYQEDWTAYNQMTGYKISDNTDWIDSFNETWYAQVTGFNTIQDALSAFSTASSNMLDGIEDAYTDYQSDVATTLDTAGLDIETFSKKLAEYMQKAQAEAEELSRDMGQAADDSAQAFKDIVAAATTEMANYSAIIDKWVEETNRISTAINGTINTLAQLSAALEDVANGYQQVSDAQAGLQNGGSSGNGSGNGGGGYYGGSSGWDNQGYSDSAVSSAQTFLNNWHGANLSVDGQWGEASQDAATAAGFGSLADVIQAMTTVSNDEHYDSEADYLNAQNIKIGVWRDSSYSTAGYIGQQNLQGSSVVEIAPNVFQLKSGNYKGYYIKKQGAEQLGYTKWAFGSGQTITMRQNATIDLYKSSNNAYDGQHVLNSGVTYKYTDSNGDGFGGLYKNGTRIMSNNVFKRTQLEKLILNGKAFDTGGYTGEWDSSGRLALLHQKEIVLNAHDTANFLAAIDILRDITRAIDLQALSQTHMLSALTSASVGTAAQVIEQEVTIHAEFPNATNHSEIEEAFDTLLNRASQFANRKN